MREELSPCQCNIVVETKQKRTTKLSYIEASKRNEYRRRKPSRRKPQNCQKKTTKLLYIEGGSIAQFNTLPRFVRFARQWGNDLSK